MSRRTTAAAVAVPPDDVASHVNVLAAVSVLTVAASQPERADTGDSASCTSQVTETSESCQPLLPSVPRTFGRITGGVMSSVLGRQSQTGNARRWITWGYTRAERFRFW